MSAELTTEGRVIGIDGDSLLVEAAPRAACASCASGCGVGRLLDGKRAASQLRLPRQPGIAPGDRVQLAINDRHAAGMALLGYGLPLASSLFAISVALLCGFPEPVQALSLLIGLLLGLGALRLLPSQLARVSIGPSTACRTDMNTIPISANENSWRSR